MATHTPGPWVAEDPDHMCNTISVFGADADGREWTVCDMGVPVDLVCSAREDLHPRLIAQQEANARLIAAAPDLLAALSALMEIETADVDMDDFDDDDSVGAYQDDDGAIKDLPLTFGHLRRARAAVAKAEAA